MMDNNDTFQSQIDAIRKKLSNAKTSEQLEELLSNARVLLKQSFQTENEEKARHLFREIRDVLEKFDSSVVTSVKKDKAKFETVTQQKTINVNPNASETEETELLMNARRHYYAGNYYEAIDALSVVLRLNPENREARDRLAQAEDNIKRGVVPDTRVPFEARSAFGRAQSLERAGRFEDAREFYKIAFEEARKGGIEKWQPATEALLRIENSLIAKKLREEGDVLSQKDKWLDAIEKYQSSLALAPDFYELQNIIETLRDAQQKTETLGVIASSWQNYTSEDINKIASQLITRAHQLPNSQKLRQAIKEANSLLERIREYESLRDLQNGVHEAEMALLSSDSCTALDMLLRALKRLVTDFKVPEFREKLEELRQRADRLRVSAVILCAERIASEGGYSRAKRILESNSENEDVRKALDKVTTRQNRELENLAKQRKEYLDELRFQSDIWFKWGVRASILGAILLIVGAIGIFINQIPTSAVVTLSSLLPSAFAKFFIDQYRELRKERLTLLSKRPEEEKLEMDAQRQRIGINENNTG